jgi:cysteine desulfurase family protein (TIGR01976 family)
MHSLYPIDTIRNAFPSLESGIAHFDGPGGTQTPREVAQKVADTLMSSISNRGSITIPEQNADRVVQEFRKAVADLFDTEAKGVVYGRSWTALAYDFSRALSKTWQAGDEIIVTKLDHDSNIRPWVQAAEKAQVKVRWAEFDPSTGELSVDAVAKLLSSKTRFVAITGASNIIGTKPNISAMAREIHSAGAFFCLDAVHLAPHSSISFDATGADIIGCSAYKFLGPHCGILVAKPELLERINNDKLLPSTNAIPERFELGTLPYELMAGTTAAIDFLANLAPGAALDRKEKLKNSFDALEQYEEGLLQYLEQRLKSIDGLTLYGKAIHRTPTLYFRLKGIAPAAIHQQLAAQKISAPAGNFYALETSRHLGLGDEGAVRVGLAPYSTKEEIDRLVDELEKIKL